MYRRPLSIAIIVFCGSAAASHALALGIGRLPEWFEFGQALDLSVPLQLEAGESLPAQCLSVELTVGDKRLARAAVQAQLEVAGNGVDAAWVRIRSTMAVNEPVVRVDLSVGCKGPVSRQFLVFANLPAAHPASALAAANVTPPRAAQADVPPHDASATPLAPGRSAERAKAPSASPGGTIGAALDKRERASTSESAAAAQSALPTNDAVLAAPRLVPDAPGDMHKDVAAQDAMLPDATLAASAAQAVASAAGPGHLMWVLAAISAALAGCVLWLVMRLHALRREREAERWWGDDMPHGDAQALDAADTDAVWGQDTARTAAASRPGAPLPAATTEQPDTLEAGVDELIDLEQQLEFFALLGEEGAAVDLLKSHLHHGVGGSPVPYLELLAIYRRRQQHEAYEQLHRRFLLRFKAGVPWPCDPEPSRGLLDYPAALAAVQASWHAPPKAMAELERQLLCKGSSCLFELAAYRDMLMLFALARDVHRRATAPLDLDLNDPADASDKGGAVSPPAAAGVRRSD